MSSGRSCCFCFYALLLFLCVAAVSMRSCCFYVRLVVPTAYKVRRVGGGNRLVEMRDKRFWGRAGLLWGRGSLQPSIDSCPCMYQSSRRRLRSICFLFGSLPRLPRPESRVYLTAWRVSGKPCFFFIAPTTDRRRHTSYRISSVYFLPYLFRLFVYYLRFFILSCRSCSILSLPFPPSSHLCSLCPVVCLDGSENLTIHPNEPTNQPT